MKRPIGLYEQVARRFNRGLFPAMQYLDGLPSEPMGYWALYDLSPAALTLLAAQSASETDLVGRVKTEQHDWLTRHFQNLIHSTLPDMRYVPWGDLQSGPNGGVTHEMAGVIDAMAWALDSPAGAHFSRWLAEKRGPRRFDGENAVFYMLYTCNVTAKPRVPGLSFTAGNQHGGRLIARSDWTANATIVTLTATDHFGDHNHYDQGSFVIYRNGLLAVDPPVYRKIRGPQQFTENHNTLLIGGQSQRPARGQSFKTVEEFQANLNDGRKLETGNMLFQKDAGPWAAAAVQFAQAYSPETVQSCVRQLLFIRPGKIVVVDRLIPPPGSDLPEVQWLLQLPREPEIGSDRVWAGNGKSWLRCRSVLPGGTRPTVSPTEVNTHRVSFTYRGNDAKTLVHLLDVGDGPRPDTPTKVAVRKMPSGAVVVKLDGREYTFSARMPFEVTSR